MRIKALPLCLLFAVCAPLGAQLSVGVDLPGVSIGINLGGYPELQPIPGYPVYYAPQADANLFFYDGLYWAYSQDGWYSSEWYNGPWQSLDVEVVPVFLLRVPVRYYRQPPMYFRAWRDDAPPRWGERWGHDWERRHRDWDHWDRQAAPRLAPLPLYQRDYGGDRYPHREAQRELRSRHYDYQPREEVARHIYQRPAQVSAPSRTEAREPHAHDRRATQRPPGQGTAPRAMQLEREPASMTVKPSHEGRQAQGRGTSRLRQPRRESAAAPDSSSMHERAATVAPEPSQREAARGAARIPQIRPSSPAREVSPMRPPQQQQQQHQQRERSQAPAAVQAPQVAAPNATKGGRAKHDDKNHGHDNRDQR